MKRAVRSAAGDPDKRLTGCTGHLYRVVYRAGTTRRERDVCCMLLAPPSLRVPGARVAVLRDPWPLGCRGLRAR